MVRCLFYFCQRLIAILVLEFISQLLYMLQHLNFNGLAEESEFEGERIHLLTQIVDQIIPLCFTSCIWMQMWQKMHLECKQNLQLTLPWRALACDTCMEKWLQLLRYVTIIKMSTQETNNMSSFDFSFYTGPCTLHAHILISVEERLQPIKQIELSI